MMEKLERYPAVMFHSQGASKQTCSLLAVTCDKSIEHELKEVPKDQPTYPFPGLISSGRLEVQTLNNPEKDQFRKILESYQPSFVYLQGEQLENGEVGSLVLQGVDLSTTEAISELFGPTLPTAVLVQSSATHAWDAFQLAHASFRLYCVENNHVCPANSHGFSSETGPHLLGNCLKVNVDPPEIDAGVDEESSSDTLPAIKIHDDDVSLRFLVCGAPSTLDASLLRSLEDGLRALLTIEIRGSKLHGKFSAPPPPLQAATFSRGVVTMRCDVSTCSSAHISLLVSGSAQTCFDDQLLENHIKNEIIEKDQLVHAVINPEENKLPVSEPRKSASIACGATVFEVCMKLPQWALQVLRQLAPDVSYRSLVALGIASIQGLPVASFEKDDAERLLFFYERQENSIPNYLMKKMRQIWLNGTSIPSLPSRQRLKVSAMRPIPHVRRHRMTPFSRIFEADGYDGGQAKANLPVVAHAKHSNVGSTSATQRKSFSASSQSKQIISLNPLPLKKHGCDRGPIQACSEEEFLTDVMQFLILRGHTRLLPQGGLTEFPDAILNGKRLDLYNLYKEVVTRGGFHVGNGINWKGQIFSKMRNYTMTNRMTGVGNTLKRHYETYLLEYELAHDDVDGECCLLCHSSAAGDWVNCGICGEWAHFGCDRRQGLGAFKDYAKTDGLEYICPHCSITNFKKKQQNGFSQGLMASRPL
ncbi:AT-rich interactive domain-containing protein 4-like [Quillaja saponaria]|uniref:AT-rich interactive domain-containing protein 4-like n=1 Tax=Quillaja saponaria TaxID=32244 RepID=A0AAD7L4G1_QUISA|nr:AT-rich interactive domain-containing protein 4-like [Quillaja saponaria]